MLRFTLVFLLWFGAFATCEISCMQLEVALLRHLMRKFDASHRVSVERVVSGIGLANVCVLCPPPFDTLISHCLQLCIRVYSL